MNRIYIGIDPGESNGFAVWDCDSKKFLSLQTLNFWSALKEILSFASIYKLQKVVIENPNLNKPVFMDKNSKEELDRAFTQMNQSARVQSELFAEAMETVNKIIRIQSTKAQRVGMNKQYAKLLIEYCELNSLLIEQIRPWLPKMNAEDFKARTGWEGRTNEHNRDAARLVYMLE